MKTIQRRTNALGELSVLYVSVLARAIEAERYSARHILERFGINDTMLSAPDARISIPRFMRMGEAAIRETGNPAIGLTMGRLSRPVDAGMAGLAAQAAPTVGDALSTLIRFSMLTSHNSRGVPSTSNRGAMGQFYSIRPYNIFNYFVVDSVLAAWTQFLRTVSGQQRVLARVTIEYPSQGRDELFEEWFNCPVQFGAKQNAIHLLDDIRVSSSLHAQPAMHELLGKQCERQLLKIRTNWSVGDRVKDQLAPLLQGETPTLNSIADQMGTAPWTLQRQLKEEGTGFRELLDETRQELASEYLRETKTSIAEVAWILGFANPAAFHKAWRRWFNISPARYRQRYHDEQIDKGIR